MRALSLQSRLATKGLMATRRARATGSLTVKAAELALAVPQVVAHRVTRMALSGPKLSARDRKEFQRMVAEKNVAFSESWVAMAKQAALANQALAGSIFKSFLSAASGKRPSAAARRSSSSVRLSTFSEKVSRQCIARRLPTPSALDAQSYASVVS